MPGVGKEDYSVLETTLQLAVPMWIERFRHLDSEDRWKIAQESADAVASQGDTLMFGGKHKFGHGGKQMAAHRAAPRCPGEGDGCQCASRAPGIPPAFRRKCSRCADPRCWCRGPGQPTYSAGEVFNFLARGLAVGAFAPGGITYRGMHWCTDHQACLDAEAAADRAWAARKAAGEDD